MRRTALTAALATFTLSSASAQIFVETYDNGHNEGDYEIWFATYNSIPSSGGNPGWYLRLDNTGGPLTCQFLAIFPNVWPNAFSGDYRAQGVTSVGLDANIVQGAFGVPATSIWEVWLVDDSRPERELLRWRNWSEDRSPCSAPYQPALSPAIRRVSHAQHRRRTARRIGPSASSPPQQTQKPMRYSLVRPMPAT